MFYLSAIATYNFRTNCAVISRVQIRIAKCSSVVSYMGAVWILFYNFIYTPI